MPKLILNTIVKNESHCILKMLESAMKISDAIVIADTGSTDGTQDLIKKFGEENNIPTYVVERPFDDF
jgi:glycosyltransferase involved in cell wall biosynthesis